MERIKDNDKFVAANLEELVKKYAHQRIIISNGEIFTGENAVEQAEEKFPRRIPLWMIIPGQEFFTHHHLL